MNGLQLALTPDPIEEAFEAFHHDNGNVYHELVRLAREWKAAGHDKCAIGLLTEVLRWQSGLTGVHDDAGFRINNNFRAPYARLIMQTCPDLAGFFDVRVRPSARFLEAS